MSKPLFIVFEGIDGCGKTKHTRRLFEWLTAKGRRVTITAEPTDSATGQLLRRALSGEDDRTPAEMAALFTLDRIGHNKEIEAALADGQDVICDRYYYSSLAYQGSLTDYDWVKRMNCDCPEIRRPDLCIFLDVPPATALERINKRAAAHEIYEKEDSLALFRRTFLAVFDTLPDPVIKIDTSDPADEVAARVTAAVEPLL